MPLASKNKDSTSRHDGSGFDRPRSEWITNGRRFEPAARPLSPQHRTSFGYEMLRKTCGRPLASEGATDGGREWWCLCFPVSGPAAASRVANSERKPSLGSGPRCEEHTRVQNSLRVQTILRSLQRGSKKVWPLTTVP